MPVVRGMAASYAHNQNGMTEKDMLACQEAVNKYNEVIIFRSTGPWAKRWIERGYPTKNFHVKGKSSDWGPHAGLVPYDGIYSKVGFDKDKAADGTKKNKDGLHSGFAGVAPLVMDRSLIEEQETRPEGSPPRTALFAVTPVQGSKDLALTARRSGDGKQFAFLARHRQEDKYDILVYPDKAAAGSAGVVRNNVFLAQDRARTGGAGDQPVPLEVMTSEEVGAGKLPMTGDYDLFAVCPTWAEYGSKTSRAIVKPGIALNNGTLNKGLSYQPGVGMDNVLDARLSTGGTKGMDFKERAAIYRKNYYANGMKGIASPDTYKMIFEASPYGEHGDMGNLTPRILRCINLLNALMGANSEKGALRRVHHNAESHRFREFGALSAKDMVTIKAGETYGDGFPLTIFQPRSVVTRGTPAADYGEVCTLEALPEFQAYATALAASGYYVPKNWIWNMHVSPSARAAANRNL